MPAASGGHHGEGKPAVEKRPPASPATGIAPVPFVPSETPIKSPEVKKARMQDSAVANLKHRFDEVANDDVNMVSSMKAKNIFFLSIGGLLALAIVFSTGGLLALAIVHQVSPPRAGCANSSGDAPPGISS